MTTTVTCTFVHHEYIWYKWTKSIIYMIENHFEWSRWAMVIQKHRRQMGVPIFKVGGYGDPTTLFFTVCLSMHSIQQQHAFIRDAQQLTKGACIRQFRIETKGLDKLGRYHSVSEIINYLLYIVVHWQSLYHSLFYPRVAYKALYYPCLPRYFITLLQGILLIRNRLDLRVNHNSFTKIFPLFWRKRLCQYICQIGSRVLFNYVKRRRGN